jgi:hypothetical protein
MGRQRVRLLQHQCIGAGWGDLTGNQTIAGAWASLMAPLVSDEVAEGR